MYSAITVVRRIKEKKSFPIRAKADLVARLESYDKNFGIDDEGSAEYLDCDESMVLPSDDSYKDINASTILPPLTRHHLQLFADRYSKSLKNALEMYENRHLVTARIAKSDPYTFTRGQCRASMKSTFRDMILEKYLY